MGSDNHRDSTLPSDIILSEAVSGNIRAELDVLRAQLTNMGPAVLRDGTWFYKVLQSSAEKWLTRNDKPLIEAWRSAHPELEPDKLAQLIISQYSKRAAVVGGTAGALVTATELSAFMSAGLTTGTAIMLVLAELGLVERLQVRMMFTLAQLYGYRMAENDVDDIGVIYAHVLKIKGAARAATYARQGGVMVFRLIGMQFLRQAIVKYGIPILSVGLGSGMNFLLTRSLGRHSQKIFSLQGQVSAQADHFADESLTTRRLLVSLISLMAAADGRIDRRERAMLKKTLEHFGSTKAERRSLVEALDAPLESLNLAMVEMGDEHFRTAVMDMLVLLAVADGRGDPSEKRLLVQMSRLTNVEFSETEFRARYRVFLKDLPTAVSATGA
ncbi:MAG: DUF533 domain-containing protein [Myxococcota bacterium]|nr:DUF533 domain-containing protein [Myxococcota bacterium]